MSVSKMKKAVAALKAYLHKDTQGQQLLDKVTREVHALRADLAATTQRAERAESLAASRLETLQAMEAKYADVDQELLSLRAQLQQQASRISIVTERAAALEAIWDDDAQNEMKELTHQSLERMFQAIWRGRGGNAFPRPAKACEAKVGGLRTRVYEYSVRSLLPNYTNHGFTLFGKSVFALTMCMGFRPMFRPVTPTAEFWKTHAAHDLQAAQWMVRVLGEGLNYDDVGERLQARYGSSKSS